MLDPCRVNCTKRFFSVFKKMTALTDETRKAMSMGVGFDIIGLREFYSSDDAHDDNEYVDANVDLDANGEPDYDYDDRFAYHRPDHEFEPVGSGSRDKGKQPVADKGTQPAASTSTASSKSINQNIMCGLLELFDIKLNQLGNSDDNYTGIRCDKSVRRELTAKKTVIDALVNDLAQLKVEEDAAKRILILHRILAILETICITIDGVNECKLTSGVWMNLIGALKNKITNLPESDKTDVMAAIQAVLNTGQISDDLDKDAETLGENIATRDDGRDDITEVDDDDDEEKMQSTQPIIDDNGGIGPITIPTNPIAFGRTDSVQSNKSNKSNASSKRGRDGAPILTKDDEPSAEPPVVLGRINSKHSTNSKRSIYYRSPSSTDVDDDDDVDDPKDPETRRRKTSHTDTGTIDFNGDGVTVVDNGDGSDVIQTITVAELTDRINTQAEILGLKNDLVKLRSENDAITLDLDEIHAARLREQERIDAQEKELKEQEAKNEQERKENEDKRERREQEHIDKMNQISLEFTNQMNALQIQREQAQLDIVQTIQQTNVEKEARRRFKETQDNERRQHERIEREKQQREDRMMKEARDVMKLQRQKLRDAQKQYKIDVEKDQKKQEDARIKQYKRYAGILEKARISVEKRLGEYRRLYDTTRSAIETKRTNLQEKIDTAPVEALEKELAGLQTAITAYQNNVNAIQTDIHNTLTAVKPFIQELQSPHDTVMRGTSDDFLQSGFDYTKLDDIQTENDKKRIVDVSTQLSNWPDDLYMMNVSDITAAINQRHPDTITTKINAVFKNFENLVPHAETTSDVAVYLPRETFDAIRARHSLSDSMQLARMNRSSGATVYGNVYAERLAKYLDTVVGTVGNQALIDDLYKKLYNEPVRSLASLAHPRLYPLITAPLFIPRATATATMPPDRRSIDSFLTDVVTKIAYEMVRTSLFASINSGIKHYNSQLRIPATHVDHTTHPLIRDIRAQHSRMVDTAFATNAYNIQTFLNAFVEHTNQRRNRITAALFTELANIYMLVYWYKNKDKDKSMLVYVNLIIDQYMKQKKIPNWTKLFKDMDRDKFKEFLTAFDKHIATDSPSGTFTEFNFSIDSDTINIQPSPSLETTLVDLVTPGTSREMSSSIKYLEKPFDNTPYLFLRKAYDILYGNIQQYFTDGVETRANQTSFNTAYIAFRSAHANDIRRLNDAARETERVFNSGEMWSDMTFKGAVKTQFDSAVNRIVGERLDRIRVHVPEKITNLREKQEVDEYLKKEVPIRSASAELNVEIPHDPSLMQQHNAKRITMAISKTLQLVRADKTSPSILRIVFAAYWERLAKALFDSSRIYYFKGDEAAIKRGDDETRRVCVEIFTAIGSSRVIDMFSASIVSKEIATRDDDDTNGGDDAPQGNNNRERKNSGAHHWNFLTPLQ